jgi:hypothetical protein
MEQIDEAVVMNGTAFGPLVRRLGLCAGSYGPDVPDLVADRRSMLDRVLVKAKHFAGASPYKVRVADRSEGRQGIGITIPQTVLATADEVIE